MAEPDEIQREDKGPAKRQNVLNAAMEDSQLKEVVCRFSFRIFSSVKSLIILNFNSFEVIKMMVISLSCL